nr:M23 family metallopeptidase [Aureivirga sp. CE67]
MPVGTEITAIRGGVVIEVVQKFNKTCPSKKCAKFNNYVIISHNDGTIAKYLHIKKGGARVKIGDEVKKGQLVALSGNVGWSTGPHLHLEINGFVKGAYQTIKTQFKISKEKGNVYLEEDDNFVREL